MPTTNINKTSTTTPAMTTEPEGSPAEGTSELPATLPDYTAPGSGTSGGSGTSPG